MRNIAISMVALLAILPAAGAAGPKINAATNIDWTKVSGTTAPSAACNSSFYGEPYTNRATGDFYVCAVSGWVLVTSGGGGGISGSATSGFLAIGTGAASIGPSLADYGISVAGTFTFPKPTIFNDGTGVAGTAALQQGTATSNSTTSVTLTVPTSVTSYRIVLPGVHATGSNTFLSCTAADPSVCTWVAGGGGGGTPCTTTALSFQFNNAGSFGCVTPLTYVAGSTSAEFATTNTGANAAASYFGGNTNAVNIDSEFSGQQGGGHSVNAIYGAIKSVDPGFAGVHQFNAGGFFAVADANNSATVAVYGQTRGTANAAGGSIFGINALTATTAAAAATMYTFEADSNVNNTGDIPYGVYVNGFWSAQATLGNAIRISLNSGKKWPVGLSLDDAEVTNAIDIGAVATSASSASQPITFHNFDSGATRRASTIAADASGNLLLTPFAGVVLSTITSSTSPICPNGTNAALTTSGCVSAIPSQYKTWHCDPGMGDGLNAINSGTYLQHTCVNETGATVTLTRIACYTDNSGTSTLNASGTTLGALLTGAVTCTTATAGAAGTQSANVLLTNGDAIDFTFVADGTSKQATWVVTGTY